MAGLTARLKQLDGYATALVQGFRVMDARRRILEPLLRDDEAKAALAARLGRSAGVRAYNHIVPLLGHDLVRDLARLVLDKDERVASLVNLHRKAKERTLHRALRERFVAIPERWYQPDAIPGIPERMMEAFLKTWAEQDKKDFAESFDEGWTSVEAAVADLEDDETAGKIGNVRSKYLAHLEMTPLDQEPAPFNVRALGLTYNDLFTFADRLSPPVYELSRIITGTAHDVDGFTRLHVESGSALWRVLAGLPERQG